VGAGPQGWLPSFPLGSVVCVKYNSWEMLFKSYHDGSMAKALVLGGGGHEFKPALCPSHIHFAIQCMVQTFACNVDLNFGIIYSSEI